MKLKIQKIIKRSKFGETKNVEKRGKVDGPK